MRGCITVILLIGGAMVAVTWLGVWVLVLLIAAVMYLALMLIGKACGWISGSMKGDEIGEWEVHERREEDV